MAIKWIDRIGETKTVGSFEFTLIDVVDSQNVMVTVDDEEHIVCKRTWNRGVFRDIMKNLDIKHLVGVVKESCGWLFKIKEAAKDYVIVTCEGYEGEEIITMNRWKKGVFGKRLIATAEKTGTMKKIIKKIVEVAKTIFFPAVISEKPISGDVVKRHITALENTLHYADFKKLYNSLVKHYHPDCGGSVEGFNFINMVYKFQAPILKKFEPIFMGKEKARQNYDKLMLVTIASEYWHQKPVDIDRYPRFGEHFQFKF